jgi:hypothetical protein
LAGTVLPLKAQTPAYVVKDGNIYPAATDKSPAFKTNVEPRKEYGAEHYVAAWGGANLLQQGDEAKVSGYGESVNLSLRSGVGFAAGFKVGQIWNFENNGNQLTVYGEKTSVTFMPSIEGEFIYANSSDAKLRFGASYSDGTNSVNGSIYQKFDMDIYALMVNPVLRVQWGRFRPYVGFGVGGAYVTGKNKGVGASGTVNAPGYAGYLDPVLGTVNGQGSGTIEGLGGGSDSDIVFAFQGLVGTDIFINKEWSVFLEYKYLGLVGLEFDRGYGLKYDMGDVYGNHLVTAGIKFHY